MAECVILGWLMVIADTDARTLRIPNRLVWPALWAVAVLSVAHPAVGVSALVAATPYTLTYLLRWCGGGDVKLAAVCGGLVHRWDEALILVALASLIALAMVGLGSLRGRDKGGREHGGHPHGPALAGATVVVAGLL
ncbi:prepilin peptidase [Gordonia sp. zg691]|uniref:prepilin peptidase n=1 Tax=Gordonia jinghuaiqii TaxID=2758710 RepID=UPI0016622000|nr:A24 family peptidase [Gordonia jinghuaiqii]MBD0861467.1 prepilin peptidase [Gordonia jinghuaiqii]